MDLINSTEENIELYRNTSEEFNINHSDEINLIEKDKNTVHNQNIDLEDNLQNLEEGNIRTSYIRMNNM